MQSFISRKKFQVVISAVCFMLITVSTRAQFKVSGTVAAAEGTPLAGASVKMDPGPYSSRTNEDGTFLFTVDSMGVYTVTVSYIGYENHAETFTLNQNKTMQVSLKKSAVEQQVVLINATRVNKNDGFAFTDLNKAEIEKSNQGKDIPYLLEQTPSLVTTSDAGGGIGYTGVRIRGSDASRINVTINGVPLNDAESQNVYFVDLPDLASSVESIQVQRGVGTSSNGTGSFGGGISIMTGKLSALPYATTSNAIGSFNTVKNNLLVGTGLIKDHWAFEGRLSRIASSGYIDRASSDLKSYYLSGGYYGKKAIIKMTVLSGKEITYQAWNGVPEYLLNTDRTYNAFTYENQVDNYRQDHYQLLLGYDLHPELHLQVTLHDTKGKGYYEEYMAADDPYGGGMLSSYGLPDLYIGNDTIAASDLVRQKWLDNDFYGTTFALTYDPAKRIRATLGGSWSRYDGDHFNELTWMRYAGETYPGYRYEDDHARKTDVNVYLKGYYKLSPEINLTGDLQVRTVDYRFTGFDESAATVPQQVNLVFFNPKFGVSWQFIPKLSWFASISKGSREPSRDDYTESSPGSRPVEETMADLETGFRFTSDKMNVMLNYYLMDYNNQLVLTGKVNDVGNYTRTNVPHSSRQGVEAEFTFNPVTPLILAGNITVSDNKIKSFDEYIDNYDDGSQQLITHTKTDLAFSPALICSGTITVLPLKNLAVDFIARHVGKQYLDNTSGENRKISDYTVCDVRLNYALHFNVLKEIQLSFVAANVFSKKYVSNGYTFSYISGGSLTTENYYYPQALVNFLGQVTLKF